MKKILLILLVLMITVSACAADGVYKITTSNGVTYLNQSEGWSCANYSKQNGVVCTKKGGTGDKLVFYDVSSFEKTYP